LESEKALLDFIKTQIKIENEIVDSINEALRNMQNPPVKSVLRGISLDSLKHAEMYDAALKLLTTVPQALPQKQLEKHRSLLEKHVKIEAELVEKIEEILPKIENRKVKLLLTAIWTDEKRHHELLREIMEILVRGETITEEDWWEILWKNVPFHGAPGG
jgi:rubrerythrin